jgi:NAD+ kinase
VLPPEATVKLQISTNSQDGVFSADGQINREIKDGATIVVKRSPYVVKFLRRTPPTHFYQTITDKLHRDNTTQTCESHHVTRD